MTTTDKEPDVITREEHEREMRVFRAKVRREAMSMAEEHDLCSVVEDTLHRLGIGVETQFVTITTVITRKQVWRVPSDLIASYSDMTEMQEAYERYATGNSTDQEEREWQNIVELDTEEEEKITGFDVSDVAEVPISWFFTSDGRVAHALRGPSQSSRPALCGTKPSWGTWRTFPTRGNGNDRCTRCTRLA